MNTQKIVVCDDRISDDRISGDTGYLSKIVLHVIKICVLIVLLSNDKMVPGNSQSICSHWLVSILRAGFVELHSMIVFW